MKRMYAIKLEIYLLTNLKSNNCPLCQTVQFRCLHKTLSTIDVRNMLSQIERFAGTILGVIIQIILLQPGVKYIFFGKRCFSEIGMLLGASSHFVL